MSSHISAAFSKLEIPITQREILLMERLVISFEMRDSHVLALNGQLLGVYPMAFTDHDRAAFFEIFGLRESDITRIIKGIPSINKEFKVASDAFNVLAAWIMHLGHVLIKQDKVRDKFLVNVAKYLHYRFFTSFVNHMLPHKANEATMLATISRLTKKFDIITYGTWKAVIEARCKNLVGPDSLHKKTIATADDDKAFIYLIIDTQTRIRDKVKLIITEYHKARKEGASVQNKSATMEIDGEKLIIQTVSTFDAMIANMVIEVLNITVFVNRNTVHFVSRRFNTISTSMLQQALTQMSQVATEQSKAGTLDAMLKLNNKGIIPVGMRAVVSDIIQSSYRYCMRNSVPLDNRAALFIRLQNIYSSSRIADPNINRVKASVAHFVESLDISPRESTKPSLRLAIILYVILKSMKYLPN